MRQQRMIGRSQCPRNFARAADGPRNPLQAAMNFGPGGRHSAMLNIRAQPHSKCIVLNSVWRILGSERQLNRPACVEAGVLTCLTTGREALLNISNARSGVTLLSAQLQ